MKKPIVTFMMILGFCSFIFGQAKPTLGVLNVDSKGVQMDPEQLGNLVRLELDKLDLFEVMDPYDIRYLVEKKQLNLEHCYGKICVVEIGQQLDLDKMMTGSVELFGDVMVVTLRLVDVKGDKVEKSEVQEFLNLENQIQAMLGITLKRMFDLEVNEDFYSKLTKKYDYESTVNVPEASRLNLSGPRMGVTIFSGDQATVLQNSITDGGFDAVPVMFQFGYQFEVKYLNQGNFQALFEIIPIITGLDQGRVIPSVSILNGMRSNKNGLEFAFGPTFYANRQAEGYFDADNAWHLKNEFIPTEEVPNNPYSLEYRTDSRGDFRFDSGFVFAVGKTFKSGRLNIPVNAFFIPSTDGHRFGVSMGFNASK